jgi:hypothetical protein
LGPFKGKEALARLFLGHRFKRSLLAAPAAGREFSPLVLPEILPQRPWFKGRRLLAKAFQVGLESPKQRLDKLYWKKRLLPILPHLPPKTPMDQLLQEFLTPLVQIHSR